jgi:medium-chain acyl-[acyl-carrier-protein] hydrolase
MIATLSVMQWFNISRRQPPARARLFCFPYAGGGAPIYRNWSQSLPAEIEVCAAQLPGRGSRIKETPFSDLSEMVAVIAEAIVPYLDLPVAFFGHSMGAMIAFELARKLRETQNMQPAHLFISGRRAPQVPKDDPISHNLPEPELLKELQRLNGTPAEVLEHPELMQLMLPLLRADFSVVETYRYRPGAPLDCPVTVFGGLQDPEVSREHLEAWGEQTNAGFSLRMLPGDHFFLNTPSAQALLLRAISQELQKHTA